MSLDNLHNDYHAAWQQYCDRSRRIEQRNAMNELGADGFRRMLDSDRHLAEDQVRRQLLSHSATAVVLTRAEGDVGTAAAAARFSSAAGPSRGDSIHVAASGVLRRHKVEEAVRQRVDQEARVLQEEIRDVASERRRLHDELKRLRRSASCVPAVRRAAFFKIDPEWQNRPLPPRTKRSVLRVDYTGPVQWYHMC
mmetsp:Transcript_86534/g.242320  ORF Transcript_86534/g.242320 Transcript_86534/m.242320 type:complete len:195 (-) Transcript_86534:221-805(-)